MLLSVIAGELGVVDVLDLPDVGELGGTKNTTGLEGRGRSEGEGTQSRTGSKRDRTHYSTRNGTELSTGFSLFLPQPSE